MEALAICISALPDINFTVALEQKPELLSHICHPVSQCDFKPEFLTVLFCCHSFFTGDGVCSVQSYCALIRQATIALYIYNQIIQVCS